MWTHLITEIRTCHCGIDSANIGQKGDLSKFDGKGRILDHFVLENFGTFGRVIKRIDIKVTKIDEWTVGCQNINESGSVIGKDIIKKIVLKVSASNWFRVAALYGLCPAPKILRSSTSDI